MKHPTVVFAIDGWKKTHRPCFVGDIRLHIVGSTCHSTTATGSCERGKAWCRGASYLCTLFRFAETDSKTGHQQKLGCAHG
ncbi:hypothetical protein ACA910_013129 [Epithemia clementina (nom. ined.)]